MEVNRYEKVAEEMNVSLYHIASYSRDRDLKMHVYGFNVEGYKRHIDALDARLFHPKSRAARLAMRMGRDFRREYIDHTIRKQAKWFFGWPIWVRILGQDLVLSRESFYEVKSQDPKEVSKLR